MTEPKATAASKRKRLPEGRLRRHPVALVTAPDRPAAPAAMHTRYGPLFRWLFGRYFEPVRFPADAQERLEDLARRGTLVYVMRSAGILNFLYFNWAFARRGLPLAQAVLGLSTFLYRPAAAILRRRTERGADAVLRAAKDGRASMVFLRRPSPLRSQGASTDDPFARLVALQRASDRPIFLVPQLLIFKRAPSRLRPGFADVVLGSAEVPGRLHAFTSFLFNYKRSIVKIGLPIDLSKLVADRPEASDEILARKARGALGVGLARELRAVVGPRLKSQHRLIEETLRDRQLRAELEKRAETSGKSYAVVEQEAARYLREISARYSPAWTDGANTVARWVFNRIYDGIEVDEEGLAVAAEASKRAPLVLCPTHRSHADYVLMSHVLIERGITPPLVAAGANLSFWPLGPAFRRMGAFFIRRSFKGQRIYAASLSAYIRKLARDGYTQEFYPEGGRTRTGRILQPKYGLISIEVDAWIAGARDDLFFVPVAIDYAKVIEAQAYARELAGAEKKREDIKGLLKTPAVLRSRWGRVHVQFDAPISLAAFAADRGFDPQHHTSDERKDLIHTLAHRIAWGMGRVQTITTTSLVSAALLASGERGVSAGDLGKRIDFLRTLARSKGARFSRPIALAPADPHEPGAVREALANFESDGQIERQAVGGETYFHVTEKARPSLDFYKNNIVHHFEEEAILAAALLSLGGSATVDVLAEDARWLSRMLKKELSFRADVPVEVTVADTARALEALGLVRIAGDRTVATEEGLEWLRFLRAQLADALESYFVAALSLQALEVGPMDRKRLVESCFAVGEGALEAGRIRHVEGLSKPTFERAVGWMVEQGLLVSEGDRKVALAEAWLDRAERDAFCHKIERFLSA